jgi:hypothetical protein
MIRAINKHGPYFVIDREFSAYIQRHCLQSGSDDPFLAHENVIIELCEGFLDLTKERDAAMAEVAEARKLCMDLICENQGLKHKIDLIGKEIHYPKCWDTAAYPYVQDALRETSFECQTCHNKPPQ